MKFLNIKNFDISDQIQSILISALLVLAIYLCFTGGYGSDEDTMPMIYVFETKLVSGAFVTSRFTGNPVAEIGIGFLAYHFGSWAANLMTFTLLILGLLIFYISFENKKKKNYYYFYYSAFQVQFFFLIIWNQLIILGLFSFMHWVYFY